MIAEKKKQVQTLIVLGALLVAAGGYAYWSIQPPSAGPVATPAEKVAKIAGLQSAGNAQIRLDLLDAASGGSAVGKKNVFQYYVPPKPPPPPPPPPPVVRPQTPVNTGPVGPPPPPPPQTALNTFKYDAFLTTGRPEKPMASINNGPTAQYNVSVGEYILGRYKINRITATSVEIEDTDLNRRQTYTRQLN